MTVRKMKVLVVDDTALYRKIVRDVLAEFPGVEVVGSAPNGKIALSKLDTLQPDMITLDQEMPEMDGMETLRQLKKLQKKVSVVMVSAHTTKGAKITLQALELGAFDFIAKPDFSDIQENVKSLREQFKPVIDAFARRHAIHLPKDRPSKLETAKREAVTVTPHHTKGLKGKPAIVTIGISTGGPRALADVVPKIPANINVPVVIVQHMPPVFTKALAESLDKKSQLTVLEAEDGQTIKANYVYIAPGGKQMKIVEGTISGTYKIKITDDPPENHCKPAVDYLFRSIAHLFPGKAVGVIMTGMGRDGTLGARLMKREGAAIYAQDEKSSVVFGMPMEVIKAGIVDEVLSLNEIAPKITSVVK